jgi:hypothetical protein
MHPLVPMFAVFLLVACTDGVPVPKRLSGMPRNSHIEFRPALYTPNLPTGGSCNFDEIADAAPLAEVIEIKRSQQVHYVGWAALSPNKGIVGGNVILRLADSAEKVFDAPVQRQDREDVAKYFNRSELLAAGFVAYIGATAVPPGSYTLSIIQDNKGFLECPVRKKIVIK